MNEKMAKVILDSNMKMSDKSEIIDYINKLERQIFRLKTQVSNLKEKKKNGMEGFKYFQRKTKGNIL